MDLSHLGPSELEEMLEEEQGHMDALNYSLETAKGTGKGNIPSIVAARRATRNQINTILQFKNVLGDERDEMLERLKAEVDRLQYQVSKYQQILGESAE